MSKLLVKHHLYSVVFYLVAREWILILTATPVSCKLGLNKRGRGMHFLYRGDWLLCLCRTWLATTCTRCSCCGSRWTKSRRINFLLTPLPGSSKRRRSAKFMRLCWAEDILYFVPAWISACWHFGAAPVKMRQFCHPQKRHFVVQCVCVCVCEREHVCACIPVQRYIILY